MARTLNSALLSPNYALWGFLKMPRKRSRVGSLPMVIHHLDGLVLSSYNFVSIMISSSTFRNRQVLCLTSSRYVMSLVSRLNRLDILAGMSLKSRPKIRASRSSPSSVRTITFPPPHTLILTFRNAKRLLHPGADTRLILSQYVATIKCLRVIDPPGVLLFKVADPIRRYLRERPDTIRSIVANLVGDDDSGDSLVDENEPIAPIQQPEMEDYSDPNWEPEPVDAGPGSFVSFFAPHTKPVTVCRVRSEQT